MRSRLSHEQSVVLAPYVVHLTVYDLGCGPDLTMASELIDMGADGVVAVDKEPLRLRRRGVRTMQRRFDEFERFPEDGDVAFVSWPINAPNPGLIRMLDAAPIIVYIGKNTDGSACGDRALFKLFMGRKLLEYMPSRENCLIIYGEKLPYDRVLSEVLTPRDPVGEEYAALQSEMLSYHTAEWRTASPQHRTRRKDEIVEELMSMPSRDREDIVTRLQKLGGR